LSAEDQHDDAVRAQITTYDATLKKALKDQFEPVEPNNEFDLRGEETPVYEPYKDDESKPIKEPKADAVNAEEFNRYLSARVQLQCNGEMMSGRVVKRKRDAKGNLIGTRNPNPILDTSMYEVEFDDGHTKAFAANLIAEAIYKQVDDEACSYRIVDEIVDHRETAEAVKPDDGFFVNRQGK